MTHLCVPQNQALGVCRGFVPDIQVCGTHGREDLVNATITSNAEEAEETTGLLCPWNYRRWFRQGSLISVMSLLLSYISVHSFFSHRLVGLVARRPPRKRQIWGRFLLSPWIFFLGRGMPVTQKLTLQWLPGQVSGVFGSAGTG